MAAIVVHVFLSLYHKDNEGSHSGYGAAIDHCKEIAPNQEHVGACSSASFCSCSGIQV